MFTTFLLEREAERHRATVWLIEAGLMAPLAGTCFVLGLLAMLAYLLGPRFARWRAARRDVRLEAALQTVAEIGAANRRARIAASVTGRPAAVCPGCLAVLLEGLGAEHGPTCRRPQPKHWHQPPTQRTLFGEVVE